jgi:hypothetical protein
MRCEGRLRAGHTELLHLQYSYKEDMMITLLKLHFDLRHLFTPVPIYIYDY